MSGEHWKLPLKAEKEMVSQRSLTVTLSVWKSLCHLREESSDMPAFLGARPGSVLASSCRHLPSPKALSIFSSLEGGGWTDECQRAYHIPDEEPCCLETSTCLSTSLSI